MSRTFIVCLFAILTLATSACSKNEPKGTPGTTTSANVSAGHAPKDAKPGSYEDWCEEHAVPESQCTLCHPDLVAAFKATGDWCAEHSLPESHCLKCNPNLKIVRGPKAN
jgi:hypothetical protein